MNELTLLIITLVILSYNKDASFCVGSFATSDDLGHLFVVIKSIGISFWMEVVGLVRENGGDYT